MGKILVIGSANADMVIHAARMPKAGETLTGYDFQINAGGKGLNQAVAVKKLGGEVSFLGMVGDDANGVMLIDTLNAYGVPFVGLQTPDVPTGVALITVVDGDNCILLDAAANARLTPDVINGFEALIADSEYCVMQLEIPVETVCRVCEIASKHGTNVVLNPAPFRDLPQAVYETAAYVIPNEHEAAALTGITIDSERSAKAAAEAILAMGVKNVVITLGDKGCVYSGENGIVLQPAIPTTAVDTTSAGDCFIGAFVTKLADGQSTAQAIAYATKASAVAVSRKGAARSIPYATEIV